MSRREKSKRKRYLEILDTWFCSKKKRDAMLLLLRITAAINKKHTHKMLILHSRNKADVVGDFCCYHRKYVCPFAVQY